jgi:adenosylcobinamide-phosphate synthase
MTSSLILLLAYIMDRLFGDPRWLPHPVIVMGHCITTIERIIRTKAGASRLSLKVGGIFLPIILVGGSFGAVWLLLKGLHLIHPWLALAAEVWLISTTIAVKGLADAGREVYSHLKHGDLNKARTSLSMIVGRDTESLDEREVSRGAVETVAENIVDAIVSPLFYAAIGGAPMAMAYRAANTLDSMVGYRDERYEHLGWASARFDDMANYLPARITAVLLVGISFLMGLQWRQCLFIIRRDARLHPSPNSGYTEAGVAGALGIQLGGVNYYKGVISNRAKLGDPCRPLEPKDILTTIRILHLLTAVFLFLCIFGLMVADGIIF